MEAKDKPRRKWVTLSIEQKIKILEKLDRSISNTAIASDFNTGKSTVTDIQKSEATPVTVMDTCQNHPTVPFSCFSRNCPYLNKTVSIQGRRCRQFCCKDSFVVKTVLLKTVLLKTVLLKAGAMLSTPVINYIREEVARQIQPIKDCLEGLERERERENYGMRATLTPISNKVRCTLELQRYKHRTTELTGQPNWRSTELTDQLNWRSTCFMFLIH